MADAQGSGVRINWVVSAGYDLDPAVDVDQIKAVGPIWGSWRTWRGCQTDNVICHDLAKSRELIGRAFQAVCNFYVPKQFYQDLKRPIGIKLYDGDYKQDVKNIEDIVAGHLAAAASDIVLMLGYDLSTPQSDPDALVNHQIQNRHGLLHSLIKTNGTVQWVAVDHDQKLDKSYSDLPNVTCDTMANALKLLI